MDEFSVGPRGLNDRNRADPEHDLVCEYLTEDVQRIALSKQLIFESEEAQVEVVVAKGEGPYRKIIGYLDVVYFRREVLAHSERVMPRVSAVIEVKTHIGSIGEVIRQIKGYKVYVPDPNPPAPPIVWVLAVTTGAGLQRQQEETLRKSGIHTVVLESFDDWARERTATPDYSTPKSVKL